MKDYLSLSDLPVMLQSKDVAKYLNITLAYARSLMSDPEFPSVHLGCRYIVSRSDFQKWLDGKIIHEEGKQYGK